MDFEKAYRLYKTAYQQLKQLGGASESKMKKLLLAHQKRLNSKGWSFYFLNGKPVVRGESGSDATRKMKRKIKTDSDRFAGNSVVQMSVSIFPDQLMDTQMGSVEVIVVVKEVSDIKPYPMAPRADRYSQFRFFYSRDELKDFKLSTFGRVASAAVKKRIKETSISYYQWSEIEKLI